MPAPRLQLHEVSKNYSNGEQPVEVLTSTLRTMLFEVSPLDPVVIGLTCVGITIVTMVASYVPARRAIRVDPMHALRAE